MVHEWLEKDIPVYLVEQLPGTTVVSLSAPFGAAHLVYTCGAPNRPVMQSAWNRGFTMQAFRKCLGAFVVVRRCALAGGVPLLVVLTATPHAPRRVCCLRGAFSRQ